MFVRKGALEEELVDLVQRKWIFVGKWDYPSDKSLMIECNHVKEKLVNALSSLILDNPFRKQSMC